MWSLEDVVARVTLVALNNILSPRTTESDARDAMTVAVCLFKSSNSKSTSSGCDCKAVRKAAMSGARSSVVVTSSRHTGARVLNLVAETRRYFAVWCEVLRRLGKADRAAIAAGVPTTDTSRLREPWEVMSGKAAWIASIWRSRGMECSCTLRVKMEAWRTETARVVGSSQHLQQSHMLTWLNTRTCRQLGLIIVKYVAAQVACGNSTIAKHLHHSHCSSLVKSHQSNHLDTAPLHAWELLKQTTCVAGIFFVALLENEQGGG